MEALRRDLFAVSIDDETTRQTIGARLPRPRRDARAPRCRRLGGPGGVPRSDRSLRTTAISLETAHPAKFPEEIRALTGSSRRCPAPSPASTTARALRRDAADYAAFKAHLMREYRS